MFFHQRKKKFIFKKNQFENSFGNGSAGVGCNQFSEEYSDPWVSTIWNVKACLELAELFSSLLCIT